MGNKLMMELKSKMSEMFSIDKKLLNFKYGTKR
jgi:hypothetical protein